MYRFIILLLLYFCYALSSEGQEKAGKNNFSVIAYYAGRPAMIDSFEVEKLTHIIFCFCHLTGNRLSINNSRDSTTILRMVELKKRNPQLKIILSLGGWGGCQTCSEVFSSKKGRRKFARSAKNLTHFFNTDGIDLDWEYPAIAGYPGHTFNVNDKADFTKLVTQLRKKLGKEKEISFAAGGFSKFIDSSIEWTKVMRQINRVNLMSYDLVHGFSSISGHHTPLYSTAKQSESTDNAVQKLLALGVSPGKIVIGAAFYGRFFKVSDTTNNGLYQPARFDHSFSYRSLADSLSESRGFVQYWDTVALAPYAFNRQRKLMATYDDSVSIKRKAEYVRKNKLNGIMFWQLVDDTFSGGLLDAINKVKQYE